MKRFFLISHIILFLNTCAFCQLIGGNGEGFTSNVTSEDIENLQLLAKVHPLVIRWPGGGDAKVAFPALDRPGLGMNRDSITALYEEFRGKKGEVKTEAMDRDLHEYLTDSQKKESDLMPIIRVAHAVKNFQVDYCLNVQQGGVDININAIQTLIDSGVNIISIVAGNETFYSYQFDFEKYRKDFEPILVACQQRFPKIPRILCVAQDIFNKHHQDWNNQLFYYIKTHNDLISGVDIHYYLLNEIMEANDAHPKSLVYKKDSVYPELQNAFSKYITLYNQQDNFSGLIAYLHDNLPGKIYQCTEFGDKEAEYWSNTVAAAGHSFYIFCTYRNSFDFLLMQNLMGNWLWSARRAAGRFDININNTIKINRCNWYALQMANEMPYEALLLNKKIQLRQPGTYYFYFNNAGGAAYDPQFDLKGMQVENYELHFVTGKFPYSSAGSTGFMSPGSDKTMDVTGITVQQTKTVENIPANAFGYVRIEVGK